MTRSARYLALLVLFTLGACDDKTASPLDLGTETAADESGKVQVEIRAVPRPGGETELRFSLKAVGTEEMDKLALDVAMDEMWLVEGAAQWSGFVPPRQPQSHRVVVEPIDGASAPRVRISVSRFRDSVVLMQREVQFTPEGRILEE